MTAPGRPTVTLIKSESNAGPYEVSEFCVERAPERDKRMVDVLFIHGLAGDAITTWGGSVDNERIVSECWPRKIAIDRRSEATFWTLGYPAPVLDRQLGTIPTAIEEEGAAALRELVHAGLGKKPIIFVTHSLGGLLAKAILVESAKSGDLSDGRKVFDHTHAIVLSVRRTLDHFTRSGDSWFLPCSISRSMGSASWWPRSRPEFFLPGPC